jgi:purine-nucleoside phosphorylase
VSGNLGVVSHPSSSTPWETTVADIVDGWLFEGEGDLPSSLLVPLENPHLFEPVAWDLLGPAMGRSGVVSLHRFDGHDVGVAAPVLGAAACAMLVDAASRRGVETVIGVGYCGGTDKALRSGDVVAASAAVTADGVSTAYAPGLGIAAASSRLLAAVDGAVRCGPVHSVAAVHLETQELVDSCAADGVLGLDMETASLYTVARERGMDALALLVVSDVPALGLATHVPSLLTGVRTAVAHACHLVAGSPLSYEPAT